MQGALAFIGGSTLSDCRAQSLRWPLQHAILLIVAVVLSLLIAAPAQAQCSLQFTSPVRGSTVMTPTISVSGTGSGSANPSDQGSVTATLNGTVFFQQSGTFDQIITFFGSGQATVTLRPGVNTLAVSGSVAGCSASDSETVTYDPAPQITQKNQGPLNMCNGTDPINGATGNQYEEEVDYQRIAGFPLEFRRYYNSLYPGNGSFGTNWRGSYDRQIVTVSSSSLIVRRPNGRGFVFNLVSGAWTPDADVNDRLVQTAAGWTYTLEDNSVETYDTAGHLLTITELGGLSQTLAYDVNGRLSTVQDPFGHVLTFTYDSSGRVASLLDPNSGTTMYGYDTNNNLTQVTYPGQQIRIYFYEDPLLVHALTGIQNENGERYATIGYQPDGRSIFSQLGTGVQRTSVTYNANGTTSITDPLSTVRTYSFTTMNNVQRTSGLSQPCVTGCGDIANTMYDAHGNVSQRTDFNGNITTYSYDLSRNLERTRTEAFGTPLARTITTVPDPTFRLPAEIDEPNRVVTFTYFSNGNLKTQSVRDTSSNRVRTTAYTYNSFGQVMTIDGPRTDVSDITTYTYYVCTTGARCGHVRRITNALGQVTTFNTYDGNGRPLTITDPNGLVRTLAYDARGRLRSSRDGSERTSYGYDSAGQLKTVTLPSGALLTLDYDTAQRLTTVTNQLGERIVFTLDTAGNRTRERTFDQAGVLVKTQRRVINALNQLQQDIGAQNQTTSYTYDNNGKLKTVTDPLQHQSVFDYDALNRLSTITDRATGITRTGYNGLDQVSSITDPRTLPTTYSIDGFGDRLSTTSPDSGVSSSTYDEASNVLTNTDAKSQTTRYQYDALNRVTQITDQSGRIIAYTYDQNDTAHGFGIGQLTRMVDPSGTTDWRYDLNGRVTQKSNQYTSSTFVFITSYVYDTSGRLQTMTLPRNQVVGYTWANAQITGLSLNGTALMSNIVYQPFSGPKTWTFGNGEAIARTYDLDGRISADSLNTVLSYDDDSRLSGQTSGNRSAVIGSSIYGYDVLDRLSSFTGNGGPIGYGYDAATNRTSQQIAGINTNYVIDPASNRIASVSGGTISTPGYDLNGSLTNTGGNGATVYVYDALGRLATATRGSTTTTFTYDGLGQRTTKATGSKGRSFVYDEDGRLVGEFNTADSGLIEETIYLGNLPVAVVTPAGTFYVHADRLNTPRQIDNGSAQAVWTWTPSTFGTETANNDPLSSGSKFNYNLRFPGQYLDTETGLHYNGNRYYNPATGRYIQSDPIGLRGGINTYAYVSANPLGFTDPSGLIRYGALANNTLGLFGSVAGVFLGSALELAPTGVTQILGVAVLAKSFYGIGANAYGISRAFSDDATFDIPNNYSSLPRTIASQVSCGETAQRVADASELLLDFASGRALVGNLPNPSGFLRSPIGYPSLNSNQITSGANFGELISPLARRSSDALQLVQTYQYGSAAYAP